MYLVCCGRVTEQLLKELRLEDKTMGFSSLRELVESVDNRKVELPNVDGLLVFVGCEGLDKSLLSRLVQVVKGSTVVYTTEQEVVDDKMDGVEWKVVPRLYGRFISDKVVGEA